MRLLFKNKVIGSIYNVSSENSWNYGTFQRNDKFSDYESFFKAIICEEGFDETSFHQELLEDKNWKIDDNGNIIDICIPAIYEDGEIIFRLNL